MPPGYFFCGVHNGNSQGALLSRHRPALIGDGPVSSSLFTGREEIHQQTVLLQQCLESVTVAGVTLHPLALYWLPGFCLLLSLISVILATWHLQALKHFQVSTGRVNPIPTNKVS